ncbi:MAG: hypothetical protein F6K47_24480 [Symploca sp. SIO2E6]|nr:hypothetical protein [Symploca sp. SIO2E6]
MGNWELGMGNWELFLPHATNLTLLEPKGERIPYKQNLGKTLISPVV